MRAKGLCSSEGIRKGKFKFQGSKFISRTLTLNFEPRTLKTMTTETTSFEDIAAREEQFQLATYKKFPFAPVRGEGCWVETSEGERYLDLYGGHAVCATGHCHPHVVEALKSQTDRILFYSNVVYSDVRAAAAEKLVACAPASITKAFFCNSGTEANENAMRMARMKSGRGA